MRASSLSHLPRSTSLQRCEQKGPYLVSNHAPDFLQVGHLMMGFGFMFVSGELNVTKAGRRFQDGITAVRTRPVWNVLFHVAVVPLPTARGPRLQVACNENGQ